MSKINYDALYAAQLQAKFDAEAKDEALARKLHTESTRARALILSHHKKDEDYARQLQADADLQSKREKAFDERVKALSDLQAILTSPAVVGENQKELTDAHKYTRDLIRNGLPTLIAVDEKYLHSVFNQAPNEILKEVLAYVATLPASMNPPDVTNIKRTFELLAASKSDVEADETHANVPQLLSRIWNLAKQFGPETQGQIAAILHHNIADGGGCIPGLVARLYAPYARLIDHFLKQTAERQLFSL